MGSQLSALSCFSSRVSEDDEKVAEVNPASVDRAAVREPHDPDADVGRAGHVPQSQGAARLVVSCLLDFFY